MSQSILDLAPPPADRRVRYGPAPQHIAHLRMPAGRGPHPCVIAIHGGFWRNQYDLAHLGHLCAALTRAGVATWNIEYRRLGDFGGGWPGTFHDVVHAARQLFAMMVSDDALRRGIDPAQVSVLGHSAGGQLASWLAALAMVPASEIRSEPLPIRAAIPLAGVLDLRQGAALNLSYGAVAAFIGGSPDEVPERYAAASPAELCPLAVPQLLVHGGRDENVPVEMSEALHAANPDVSTLVTFPDADHFDPIDPRSEIWPEVLAAILAIAT